MAENEKKETKEGKVIIESTEGLKRQEQVDGFKRTMQKLREGGKISFLLTLTIILAGCLISRLNIWSLPGPVSTLLWILFAFAVIVWYFSHSFKMAFAWENGVVFRMGRIFRIIPPVKKKIRTDPKSGEKKEIEERRKRRWDFILWPFDRIEFVNMWERRIDLPIQRIILREELEVKTRKELKKIPIEMMVDVIFYFKIKDAAKALTEVEDIDAAVHDLVLAVLRKRCAGSDVLKLIGARKKIADEIHKEIDGKIGPWGATLTKTEFKDVDLPDNIEKIFLRVFEADKEKRAVILKSEGEAQFIENVYTAINKNDPTLGIRSQYTLEEMAKGPAATIFIDKAQTPAFIPGLIAALKTGLDIAKKDRVVSEKPEEETEEKQT